MATELVKNLAAVPTLKGQTVSTCIICSCTGGLGTYAYQYTTSANADGYNSWKFKTVETLPDGNTNTYYTNFAGQVMLEVFEDAINGDQWRTFHQYDSAGRMLLKANPSAVTGHDET